MRRALPALVALVAVLAGAAVPADPAPAATKAKVKCHWVKATKKRKRHRVCVKVKAKKRTPAKATAPATAKPSAPTTPAPSAGTPTAPVASTPDPSTPVPAPTTPAAPDPATPVAARLQATTREWSIQLSRPALPAGASILQLVNRGEDAHDLHLRPASGGADLLSVASTEPGAVADVSATLAAGTYTLYCSLPGHEAAGMKATLTVQ